MTGMCGCVTCHILLLFPVPHQRALSLSLSSHCISLSLFLPLLPFLPFLPFLLLFFSFTSSPLSPLLPLLPLPLSPSPLRSTACPPFCPTSDSMYTPA